MMLDSHRTTGGLVAIHRGDCRELLETLEPGAVGALVTDPPYGIRCRSKKAAGDPYAAWWNQREIAGDRDTSARDHVLAWARERSLPWACFGSWKAPRPSGCRGVLVWDKGPISGRGDLSFPWKASWEEIYVGGPGWKGRRDEGVLAHYVPPRASQGRVHQHQKPVSLMRDVLAKLPPGTVVLDPFMGSGSTGLACVELGLPFVGCELDPATFETARTRLGLAAA